MHSRDLVELAAVVAVHAPALIRSKDRPPQEACQEYWTASRCRLDRWMRLLKRLGEATNEPARPALLNWVRIAPVLEEIFAGELLSRVWCAVAMAHDRARDEADLEPVARNVWYSHLEARRRLLALVAEGRVFDEAEVAELTHLRERIERWCDMLLAHLAREIDVTQFAYDPARAVEFAADLDYPATAADRHFTAHLVLASFKASFASCLSDRTPNTDLNRRLGAAIIGCFRDELLAAAGPIAPQWLDRLDSTADDAEILINQLVGIDDAAATVPEQLN